MNTIWRLFFGLIDEAEGRALLAARNPNVEVVFTGRGAPQWLLDEADFGYRHGGVSSLL